MTEEQSPAPEVDGDEPVFYLDPGASWLAVLFGPGFALLGIGVELATVGPVFYWLWLGVGAILSVFAALWVYARRKFCTIRVTGSVLQTGTETVPIERISEVVDEEVAPLGSRVLGGGIGVPRKYDEVPLQLDDESVVVAWARDGEALRAALHDAVGA